MEQSVMDAESKLLHFSLTQINNFKFVKSVCFLQNLIKGTLDYYY